MEIRDRHMYHGAAFAQIAEHEQFTAINRVNLRGGSSQGAFLVNDSIGVYLKHAREPTSPPEDYVFTFAQEHKDDLAELNEKCTKTFVVLVCVEDKHICCIPYSTFLGLVQQRIEARGEEEDQSTILLGLPAGGSFRVDMNRPYTKGEYLLEEPVIIPRNHFPRVLFE